MGDFNGAWSSVLRSLTLPQDAGPDDTAIVIGQEIPPEIEFDGDGNRIVAAIIWRYDASAYYFEAMSTDGAGIELRWTGIVNLDATVDVVTWMTRMAISGGGLGTAEVSLTWGDSVNGAGNFDQFAIAHDFRWAELNQGRRGATRRLICSESEGVNGDSAADTTTSAAYVNMAGPPSSFTFHKFYDASRIKVRMEIGLYSTQPNTDVRFGVRINGVDYDVCKLYFNTANQHQMVSGTAYIPGGIAAGSYTVQGRWYRLGGAGTLTRDANDSVSISADEVTN